MARRRHPGRRGGIPGARETPRATRRRAVGGRARSRRQGESPQALSRAQCTSAVVFLWALAKCQGGTIPMTVKISARPNGPYLIEGECEVYDPSGKKLDTTGKPKIALRSEERRVGKECRSRSGAVNSISKRN